MNEIAREARFSDAVAVVRENLLHVRRIHFLAFLTSATLIYLVLLGWSPAPSLISDLHYLRQVMDGFRQQDLAPSDYVQIQWTWANQEADKLLHSLQVAAETDRLTWALASSEDAAEKLNLRRRGLELLARRSKSKDSARHAFRIIKIDKPPRLGEQDVSMGEIASTIGDVALVIESVKRVSKIEGTIALGRWADQHVLDGAARIEVDHLEIRSWPMNDGKGKIVANVVAVYEKIRAGRGGHLEVKRNTHSKTETFLFESEQRRIRVDAKHFWANFPVLTGYSLERINDFSLGEAVKWARDQRTANLESTDAAVGGIKVKGSYVGLVGPPGVLLLLTYLLCYLTHISESVSTFDPGEKAALIVSSPWLGAMVNVWARGLGLLTLTLAPFLGVALPLWRFTGLNVFLSSFLGVLVSVAGGSSLIIGAKIARGEP